MRPAAALAERLGLAVRDSDLLEQALVHSSWLHEHPDAAPGHNERLEFLGDAVVNLAISDALFAAYPTDDEGLLSARRAAIVSTVGLARLAHRIDLGGSLFLGEGEAQRGGRRRPSLLASAFEALAGGAALKSPKSRLQEFTQRRTGSRPDYHVIDATGPDHEKLFRVEVVVEGRVLGAGEGPSRRVAETAAAVHALEQLRSETADRKASGSGGGRAAAAETPAADDHPSQWSG